MLKCESQAHEQEHGIEVLLPWLQSKNANLKILPLVFGHSNFEQLEVLGESLAQLIDQLVGETLLVISSDMNHFEDTDTTQIKDTQAIDAMCSGDEQKLFETCLKNQISMCGMRPAVAVMNALKKSAPIAPQLIARSDSSSVSGDRTRVVGYAGVIIK
jgi:AmmeMemoRadiSam system protein B